MKHLEDYDTLAAHIAKEPHFWGGEPKTAYSAVILGHIVNELVRRVDPKQRDLDKFVHDEINEPLQTEFFFQITDEKTFEKRVAFTYQYPLIRSLVLVFDTLILEPIRVNF